MYAITHRPGLLAILSAAAAPACFSFGAATPGVSFQSLFARIPVIADALRAVDACSPAIIPFCVGDNRLSILNGAGEVRLAFGEEEWKRRVSVGNQVLGC